MNLLLLANSTPDTGLGGLTFLILLYLVLLIAVVAGLWKTFEKAKQPGWGAIVPIYNTYLMLKIAGRPGWWLLLYLIPFVNLIVQIIVALDVAKAFKKGPAFGIFGLWLFSMVGFLILGFGDDKYSGVPKH